MTELPEVLLELPQLGTLNRIVDILARRPEVAVIWLGGSLAGDKGDLYSDIDLRVAVDSEVFDAWRSPDVAALLLDTCPGKMSLPPGENDVLHHIVLANGEILDLYIQRFPPQAIESQILILFTRDADSTIHAPEAVVPQDTAQASGPDLQRAIEAFWINSHKHRKVLHRDLDLIAHLGVQSERDLIRRLWYTILTGKEDTRAKTIHTFTAQARAISAGLNGRANDILGMPMRTRDELVAVIEVHRDVIAQNGRDLASTLSFDYPSDLEAVVRLGWEDWRKMDMR